jgi:DNA-binding transcriptional ArsR family regulator
VSQPLVSQHLRVLRSSGVVVVTRRGREAHYAVADDHVTHVIEDAIAHVLEEPPIHPSTEKEITP